MNETEERISALLTDRFKVKQAAIGPEATLGSLSFDSLVLIEFGLVLDKEFDVLMEDGELTEEMTVAALAELLRTKGVAG